LEPADPKPLTTQSKTATSSSEESQPVQQASIDAKVASRGNVQDKKATEQALKDMINTYLILPAHNGNNSSQEPEKTPHTVVEETGKKRNQSDIDLETQRTLLKMFLLQLREGWLWLFHYIFGGKAI
jgi:hypothetical protein